MNEILAFEEFLRAVMAPEIEEIANNYPERRSLVIDYKALEQFNPELADELISHPEDYIKAAEVALENLKFTVANGKHLKAYCRFRHLPESRNIMVSDLGAEHLDKFIRVEGIVSLSTDIKPVIKVANWECMHCGEVTKTRPEKNSLKNPDFCKCGRRDFKHLEKEDTFVNMQNAQMQDLVEKLRGNAPTSHISLWMEDDLCNIISPGEKFMITGILRKRPVKKDGKLSAVYEKLLEVNHLEKLEKEFEALEISESEKKELIELSKQPDLQELIIRSVAPSIYGHDEVKLAIALQLFGGNFGKSLPDGKKLRGEIHALLIGDPGCLIDDERVVLGNGAIAKLGQMGTAHLQKINVPVLTGQGYTRDYAKVFHAYKQQPILEIITESGKCIKGTYNHPLLAVDGMKKEWKRLDELKVGDRLATISWIPCTITKPLELQWKKIERKFGPKFKAILPKVLDLELAGFLGYVQGDGWVTRTEVAMDVIPEESDLIPKLVGKIEKLFAIKPKIITEHRPGKKPINVIHIRSTDIAFNLQFLREKRVPDLVLQSGNAVASQYLSWLFEADGSVFSKGRGKKAVTLRTSKERVEFLRDVQILLLRFGIHSRILANESLVIRRANSIKKFSDAIGFQSQKKKGKLEKLVLDTADLHHKLGNQLSERIVSIKEAGIADVFDVEIPKGHRFIANGIISHNTSKTTMLMYVKNLAPKCIYVSGKGTSGVGLCVAPDSLVIQNDRGIDNISSIVKGKWERDVYEGNGAFSSTAANLRVMAINEDLSAQFMNASKVWRIKAPEMLRKIKTRRGKELITTLATPILSASKNGSIWKKAQVLKKGDFVATSKMKMVHGKIIKSIKHAHSNLDLLPKATELFGRIKKNYKAAAKFVPWEYVAGRRRPKREQGIKILNCIPYDSQEAIELRKLCNPSIYWDEIISAETINNETMPWVYDFTIDSHAFLANGIVVHNTASAEKDEFGEGWVLKAGAMVLASGGQVNIDEIDKMDENDRVAMHEALESGQISVAKAGIVTTFKAKTAVLAAANPKLGRFNPNEPPASQFDLSPTLQSIDYAEPIIVRKDGKIKVAKMGEIIEEYYRGFGPQFSEPVYITDLDVPSFDPKTYKISWKPVQYVFRHKLGTKMLEVRLETGRKVKITEGHSIFVLENGKVVPKKGGEIKVGDFAAIPKKLPENIEIQNEINLIDELLKLPESKTSGIYLHNAPIKAFERIGKLPTHWAKQKILALKYAEFLTVEEKRNCTLKTKGGSKAQVPATIPIDSRIMRFFGYYIAEGSMFISNSKEHLISLAFGAHEKDLHADVAKICLELFNHKITKISDKESGMKVNIANKLVFLLFNDILKLSKGAKTKEVPEIVFNSPADLQKEFLRAYHAGDYCATVSEKLASDVLYLLLQNDVLASMHEWQPKNTFIKGRKINPSLCYSLVDAKQKILEFKSTKPYLRVPVEPFRETLKSLSMSNFSGNLRGKNRPLKGLTNNILNGRLSNNKLKMKAERMMKFGNGPLSLAEFISEIDPRTQTLNVIETYRSYLNRLEKRGLLEKVLNSQGTIAYQISKLGAETIENYKNLMRLSLGDLGFAKIKSIREVLPTTEFVYDVSTPGCENFVAGFGGIICHNSRFDLIFPIKDVLDEGRDRKLAEHILKGHMYSADNDNKDSTLVPPIDLNLLRKYIAYARKNYSPALSQEASEKIKEFYLKLRRLGEKQNNYPVTARQIEGLIRLSEASAKMRLSSIVEASDADRAINLTEYVLQNVFMDKETGRIDSDIINIGQAKSRTDRARTILSIIEEKEKEVDMVAIEDIIKEAEKVGIDEQTARRLIEDLHKQTELYRPKSGYVRSSKSRKG